MPTGVVLRYVPIRLASMNIALDTTQCGIRTGVRLCKWVGGRGASEVDVWPSIPGCSLQDPCGTCNTRHYRHLAQFLITDPG